MTDISDWIEKHADFDPDKIAIRFEGDDITYQRFAETVRRYARTLKLDYRVKRGDRVAYLGLNSPNVVYLLFACARIGAIFSPLNWRLTVPEHVYILSDSAATLLFCDHDFKDTATGFAPICPAVTSSPRILKPTAGKVFKKTRRAPKATIATQM